MNEELTSDVVQWHRRLCRVTDWLYVSGDLSPQPTQRDQQVKEWRHAGITDVVDVREEWTDESFLRDTAPTIRYWHLGTHDNGGAQDREWFLAGLAPLEIARKEGGALLVHCHMGINRGPSMAFFYLLREGWPPEQALEVLRDARPIAAMSYANDAAHANSHLGRHDPESAHQQQMVIDEWFRDHHIDVARLIRLLRTNE